MYPENLTPDVVVLKSAEQRVWPLDSETNGFLSKDSARISGLEQRFRACEIMILPRRQHQAEGIAQGIDECVDFGGQSSARSADGLRAIFFRAPALC